MIKESSRKSSTLSRNPRHSSKQRICSLESVCVFFTLNRSFGNTQPLFFPENKSQPARPLSPCHIFYHIRLCSLGAMTKTPAVRVYSATAVPYGASSSISTRLTTNYQVGTNCLALMSCLRLAITHYCTAVANSPKNVVLCVHVYTHKAAEQTACRQIPSTAAPLIISSPVRRT